MAELSVFVMMVVIYLGMARCEEHREHVNLEIVKNFLPPSLRHMTEVFAYLLALLTVGLLLYSFAGNAWASYVKRESLEGTVELRIWPVKFIIVVGLVFFWVQILLNTIEQITKTWNSRSD
jgi:TRAP-type C4-dicarboxylate transport system permease small subunit